MINGWVFDFLLQVMMPTWPLLYQKHKWKPSFSKLPHNPEASFIDPHFCATAYYVVQCT